MSERNLRPSTSKATERQKEVGKTRDEIKKLKKTSTKLKNICREEEKLYVDSALELAEYSVRNFYDSNEVLESEIPELVPTDPKLKM